MNQNVKKLRKSILKSLRISRFDNKGVNAVWANTVAHIMTNTAYLNDSSLECIWNSALLALPDTRVGNLDKLSNQIESLISDIRE